MKHTVKCVNGIEAPFTAYGPFVNSPGNGAKYYAVECGFALGLDDSFILVDGFSWDTENIWVQRARPLPYAFVMAITLAAMKAAEGGEG